MLARPRRNRLNAQIRGLVRETTLSPQHLVLPLFVQEGEGKRTPISSMPGQARLSVDLLVETAALAFERGVAGVALFPALADGLKDARGSESTNSTGLLQRAVRALKAELPALLVITDVADLFARGLERWWLRWHPGYQQAA